MPSDFNSETRFGTLLSWHIFLTPKLNKIENFIFWPPYTISKTSNNFVRILTPHRSSLNIAYRVLAPWDNFWDINLEKSYFHSTIVFGTGLWLTTLWGMMPYRVQTAHSRHDKMLSQMVSLKYIAAIGQCQHSSEEGWLWLARKASQIIPPQEWIGWQNWKNNSFCLLRWKVSFKVVESHVVHELDRWE